MTAMRPHRAEKFSRVYVVPTIQLETVVHMLAPRNRNTFVAETDVPATAIGYHSLTWVKERVMNPPKNPNSVHIANQNQYESTSPARANTATHIAANAVVPQIMADRLDLMMPREVSAPMTRVLTILPTPRAVIIHAEVSAKP